MNNTKLPEISQNNAIRRMSMCVCVFGMCGFRSSNSDLQETSRDETVRVLWPLCGFHSVSSKETTDTIHAATHVCCLYIV